MQKALIQVETGSVQKTKNSANKEQRKKEFVQLGTISACVFDQSSAMSQL